MPTNIRELNRAEDSSNCSGQGTEMNITPTEQRFKAGKRKKQSSDKSLSNAKKTKAEKRKVSKNNFNEYEKNEIRLTTDSQNWINSATSSGESESGNIGVCTIVPRIFDKKVRMIVDSGSAITIMSEEWYNIILKNGNVPIRERKVSDFPIKGVTSVGSLDIFKKSKFNVEMNGITIPVTFYIAKKITYPVVLGNDFLNRYNAILDYAGEELLFSFKGSGGKISFSIEMII